MDALKAAAAGGGAGGADAKQDAQAEDYVYTRTMSEERLKLRTFVRSIWMSGFIYSVGPRATTRLRHSLCRCSSAWALMCLTETVVSSEAKQ